MTQQQKQYIEQNIMLIETANWKEFFKRSPKGLGALLYIAGIDCLEGLTKIPLYSFSDCEHLKTVCIPDNIKCISYHSFYNCIELRNVFIGKHVKIIEDAAFWNCINLESVALPKSVKTIQQYAFCDCSNLHSIIFDGSKTEFRKIDKHNTWIDHTVTIKCLDGELVYKRK